MSVSSISTGATQQANYAKLVASKPAGANTKPKDADGDNDSDTSAKDVKGLDVKG